MTNIECTITELHCEQCGNTDPSDVSNTYSGCCNEIVTQDWDCRGFHLEAEAEKAEKAENQDELFKVREAEKARDAKIQAQAAKAIKADKVKECKCGCGEQVTRNYRPGHDARHASLMVKEAVAGTRSVAAARAELPTPALKAKFDRSLARAEAKAK